jgi:hypothetical protein
MAELVAARSWLTACRLLAGVTVFLLWVAVTGLLSG